MKGDLHCHTRLSDGSVGIEEIVSLARGRGLDVIAITDHDCMAGTIRAKMIGEKQGVQVIPGVEISCTDKISGRNVHLLCYSPDFPDRLEGLCHKNQVIRKKAGQIMMLKAKARFGIDAEFIMKRSTGSTNLYKQHIMHALLEAGCTDMLFGEVYEELFIRKGEGNIAVNPIFPAPEEVLQAIRDAGGIAVLAHPAHYDNFDTLERLIPLGLDGVEVYHPSCDTVSEARLLKLAKEHKLLVTGGSDFHGMYSKKSLPMGAYTIADKQLDDFLNYKARKKRQQRKLDMKKMQEAAAEIG